MTPKASTPIAPDKKSSSPSTRPAKGPITLAIDIGGSGLKAMLLDAQGTPISERQRLPTPAVPSPKGILEGLEELRGMLPDFDR
ncbi:MAG TPA: hypothetical protein VGH84_13875, partial [Steroidobacteraceae bacterium]